MLRTVVLRHDLPNGSFHYDWMLERPAGPRGAGGADERRLMTFRTGVRPDDPASSGFEAERIGDHRVAYLTFEGELSGGRGAVSRVAEGVYEADEMLADTLHVVVKFAGVASREIVGRRTDREIWRFSLR
jgi:hypothetical protein